MKSFLIIVSLFVSSIAIAETGDDQSNNVVNVSGSNDSQNSSYSSQSDFDGNYSGYYYQNSRRNPTLLINNVSDVPGTMMNCHNRGADGTIVKQ